MKRWALMGGEVCITVTEQETQPDVLGQWREIPLTAGPGWRYVNDEWLSPIVTPNVPQSVTMRQGREVLIDRGLLDSVNTIIAAIPDPLQRAKAENYFNMSNTMERENVWVKNIGAALGLSDTQLDELFVEAATL